MKNLLKIVGTAILFFGLSSSATAANTVNNGLTQLSTKSLADSPYALDCKGAAGGKNCTLIRKNKVNNSQLENTGNGETDGFAIATDSRSGNVYITGRTNIGLNGQLQHGVYDYFLIKYDAKGNLKWTKQGGASGGDTEGYGIATDISDNVYITGNTDVGINGHQQQGQQDYFIIKYNASGVEEWTQQIGGTTGITRASAVAADSSGNVYITGNTNVGINGQKQNGGNDYYVVKYDASGILQWSQQVGAISTPNGNTRGYAIATDNNGNVYVGGLTTVGINGQYQKGYWDYFIVKYNTNGKLDWTQQVGGIDGYTIASSIITDNAGNIYMTGSTYVGINGQKQNGNEDYFVVKYDASGVLQWTHQVGASGGEASGMGIVIDSSGSVYVGGYTNVGINGQPLNGMINYYIVKYDASGKQDWTRQVGASGGNTTGRGIAAIKGNVIYITGLTDRGINGQPQNGAYDAFTAAYNSNGTLLWGNQVGG